MITSHALYQLSHASELMLASFNFVKLSRMQSFVWLNHLSSVFLFWFAGSQRSLNSNVTSIYYALS